MQDYLDPGAERIVEMIRSAGKPPPEELTPEQGRLAFRIGRAALSPPQPPVASIIQLGAPGPAGDIPLRLYRGADTAADALLPAFVFFHSGGWVAGDLDTHDVVCRTIATLAHCAVVSVDYRLAPEHRFPAAVEDAWAALRFIADGAVTLGLDPKRIAVGGDSAGGNLAAVVALMARDAGAPSLVLQALIYPATDFAGEHPSLTRLGDGPPLSRKTLAWFAKQYLVRDEDRHDWRASPLLAADLAGAAPAFLVTCGFDPLEDEGKAYGERLCSAGVPVRYRRFPGQIHGFITMGRVIPETAILLGEIASALDHAFHGRDMARR